MHGKSIWICLVAAALFLFACGGEPDTDEVAEFDDVESIEQGAINGGPGGGDLSPEQKCKNKCNWNHFWCKVAWCGGWTPGKCKGCDTTRDDCLKKCTPSSVYGTYYPM